MFMAMFFDSLDGRVARLTSTASEFGKEYDSLPTWCRSVSRRRSSLTNGAWNGSRNTAPSGDGSVGSRLSCMSLRRRSGLARFNSNVGQDKRFFQGLASPAAAAGVVAMVWLATHYEIKG